LEMTHMFPGGGASSSSTSMSSQKSETDDDRMIAMVLSEEYAKLDGAMAKRLTNLTSIPHVPRINTYFPTYSDATMDHYRLLDRSGEWGDHVTLQAAADKFAAKICLLTSFRDTCFVEIVPQYQTPQREIWLSFWSEVHYNSLYDARGEMRNILAIASSVY
ncbi:hypothetical protein BAE44_0011339, partial [Dichanthelium oligosanthes]